MITLLYILFHIAVLLESTTRNFSELSLEEFRSFSSGNVNSTYCENCLTSPVKYPTSDYNEYWLNSYSSNPDINMIPEKTTISLNTHLIS